MTQPAELHISLARLEGKVDTLTVKVDAGDRNGTQLIEIVKSDVAGIKEDVADLKLAILANADSADKAISRVRVNLEDQIKDYKMATDRAFESAATERGRLLARMDKADAWINRLIGGCLLAGALSTSGLIVALMKGLS